VWHGEKKEVIPYVNITEVLNTIHCHFHTVRFVHCEVNYKLYQPAPTNALHFILCVLLLIGCYMFRHSCHLQGTYTNVVTMCSNKIVSQGPYIPNVQLLVKIYSIENVTIE
jgi:hypothetical protein